MNGGHDATQPTGRDDHPGPDLVPASGGAAARNGAGMEHLANPQRRAVEQAANDLAIAIAFDEVLRRRGFSTSTDVQAHLRGLLSVLTEEGGL